MGPGLGHPGSPERAAAAERAYDLLRTLDDTRPIVENSGWAHVRSDLVDWHYYEPDIATWKQMVAELASGVRETFPVRLGPDFIVDKSLNGSDAFPRAGVPILNSECGEGFTSVERAWHLRWETQELRRHDRFAGYVYTELADVEHECAGLLTEHRTTKDWGGCVPADINAETVIVVDLIPERAGADLATPVEPSTSASTSRTTASRPLKLISTPPGCAPGRRSTLRRSRHPCRRTP